jgi:hypothetical protein
MALHDDLWRHEVNERGLDQEKVAGLDEDEKARGGSGLVAQSIDDCGSWITAVQLQVE